MSVNMALMVANMQAECTVDESESQAATLAIAAARLHSAAAAARLH